MCGKVASGLTPGADRKPRFGAPRQRDRPARRPSRPVADACQWMRRPMLSSRPQNFPNRRPCGERRCDTGGDPRSPPPCPEPGAARILLRAGVSAGGARDRRSPARPSARGVRGCWRRGERSPSVRRISSSRPCPDGSRRLRQVLCAADTIRDLALRVDRADDRCGGRRGRSERAVPRVRNILQVSGRSRVRLASGHRVLSVQQPLSHHDPHVHGGR